MVKLGEGTYGAVYQGTERETGKIVAFKRMLVVSADEGVPGTAIREICLLKELHHDNVVALFEVLFDPPKITLIFEYCDFDLKRYMETRPNGCLNPLTEVRPMLKQMFAGLEYLHARDVVHRDMKPQNIFLNLRPSEYPSVGGVGSSNSPRPQSAGRRELASGAMDGPGEYTPSTQVIVKLGDFGLARVENIPVKKYSHEVVTLWYRSPDVLMGSALYGFPVDLWSMGAIFYEMVTGVVLFNGRNEDEQMLRMFRLLGSPTKETWPSMRSYPGTDERLDRVRRAAIERENRSASSGVGSSGNGTTRRRSDSLFGRVGDRSKEANNANCPENTYNLPPELWFPTPLFTDFMASTGFRDAVGEDGVDLLRRCLMYEPSQRITAAEAMRHPYLKNVATPHTGSIDQLMTSLEQTLRGAGL